MKPSNHQGNIDPCELSLTINKEAIFAFNQIFVVSVKKQDLISCCNLSNQKTQNFYYYSQGM